MAGGKGAGGQVKAVSKYLALVLRHKPEAAGLVLDAQGWAPVPEVLAAVQRRFGAFSREELEALVRSNDKQRYALDETGTRIRASQGHSVEVELGLQPVAPPPVLYHGTAVRFLPSILEEGLVKGKRHHVHLSGDMETARTVDARRAGETVILEVRAAEMAAAGHLFYRSANGVWLTEAVPLTGCELNRSDHFRASAARLAGQGLPTRRQDRVCPVPPRRRHRIQFPG
jgi:putative RNA 2'-phosphotransferase